MTIRQAISLGCWVCSLLLPLLLTGCGVGSWRLRPNWSSLVHRSSKISPDATQEEILAAVNAASEPIHAWRSTSAQVNVSGVPIPLKARVAVEEPNHLRMTISHGLSGQSELDLGSSEQHLWFWAREMEPPAIMAVNHCDLESLQQHFPVPVQPEWMMEVLGVHPIDATNAQMIRNPDDPYTVKLVRHHTSGDGKETRRITTIDLRKAEIREHLLYDSEHRLVASATLKDYQDFPETTARLPQRISIHWSEQDVKMTLSLHGVEINPPEMPTQLWEAPQIAGCPVRHLAPEQIAAPLDRRQVRPATPKPRPITEYALDEKSGAWLENQYVKMPAEEGSGKARLPANPGMAPQMDSPFFQESDIATSVTPVGHDTGAPPFPVGLPQNSQNAQVPENNSETPPWARTEQTADRLSRDGLIRQ